MKGHSLIANGNPNGTAKEGTKYLADVWNDNIGNLHEFVRKSGYNLISDDVTQLHKAIRANWVSTYVYNTSAIETQTVDDIVLGSDNNYYRCKNDGVIGDDPVGSITGNWEILPISEQIQLQLDSKQDTLISGVNIKTVNGTSLLNSGDLIVSAGSGGYAANVYFTTVNSTTNPSYKQLSYIPSSTETTISVTVNNNTVLLEDYIFDGDVKTTTIPAGEWGFTFDRFVDNTAGDTRLRFDIFARTSGGVETVLFSLFSAEINDLYYVKENILKIQPSYAVNATDRIGVKVYGTTTRTNNTTISFKLGNGDASHFNTPLEIRHSQLRARDEVDSHPIGAITNLQSALDSKQPIITGAATTITNSGLTANRVVITSGTGKITVSSITNIELAYLSGLSSNLQSALDSKYDKSNLGMFLGFCFLNQYASTLDGTVDISTNLQNAMNNNNVVYIPPNSRVYINSYVQIPQRVSLLGLGTSDVDNGTVIQLGSNGKIQFKDAVRIENLTFRKVSAPNTNIPIVSRASFSGTGLEALAAHPVTGVVLKNIGVFGFNVGIDIANGGNESNGNSRGKWVVENVKMDNNIDISMGYCLDVMRFKDVHSYPYLGSPVIGTGTGVPRQSFIEAVNVYTDWTMITDCFVHSSRKFINGYFGGKISGGGYDLEDYSNTLNGATAVNVGLDITLSPSARGLTSITGMSFNGGQIQARFNFDNDNNNIAQATMTGCTHERSSQARIWTRDVNNTAGGGVLNITGMINGNNGGATSVISNYHFVVTGYSKINVVGWTNAPTTDSPYFTDATAVFQSTGQINL